MEIAFEAGFHGDLFVNVSGQQHDFGYLYVLKFPLNIWLAHFQLRKENFFKRVRIVPLSPSFSKESQEVIESARAFASMLPLSLEQFNTESSVRGFSSFSNGSHSLFYECTLKDQELRYALRERDLPAPSRESFCIGESDFLPVVQRYVDFAGRCGKIGKYAWEIPSAIVALRDL